MKLARLCTIQSNYCGSLYHAALGCGEADVAELCVDSIDD